MYGFFIHTYNKSVEGSILYIENIEKINSRGCYWIDTKPKYVIKKNFVCLSVCMFTHHVKTNGSISMKLGIRDTFYPGKIRKKKNS